MSDTKVQGTAAPRAKRHARPKPELPQGTEPLLVDSTGAAALLGVSRLTVVNWESQGLLKPVQLPTSSRYTTKATKGKILRRVLYAVADLRKFVADATARG